MSNSVTEIHSSPSLAPSPVFYPDSDGQPMSDNTEQFDYIVIIKLGLEWLFADDPNVFIAGDLLWYPVEGNNQIRIAPDVMAAFGRPKGRRGSYRQWEEGGIAPQAAFEILSPGNTVPEMNRKFDFYERYGIDEYYVYDPDRGTLRGWLRVEGRLTEIANMNGWISPRLKVRFELVDGALKLFGPDGRPFTTYVELARQAEQERLRAEQEQQRADKERQRADKERQRAEQERQRADEEHQRADEERQRADEERQRAEQAYQRAEQERKETEQERQRTEQERQRANNEQQRAEQERQRAERLALQLRALGIEPQEEK